MKENLTILSAVVAGLFAIAVAGIGWRLKLSADSKERIDKKIKN